MHPDAVIAIAASKNSQRADARRSSATRSAGCRGSGRASSSACGWRSSAADNPKAKGVRAGKPRPVHLGRRREGLLRDDASRIINKAIAWLEERDRRQAGLRRRRRSRPLPRGRAPRRRGAADAGDPRPDLGRTRTRSAISTTSRRCSSSSARRRWRRWRRSAPPAPTISCAPRSGRWWSTSIRRTATSTPRSPGWKPPSPPIARTTPPITSAASTPTARPCATRTRSSISCPASA